MTGLFENPMGLDGFEFVAFASPVPGVLESGETGTIKYEITYEN